MFSRQLVGIALSLLWIFPDDATSEEAVPLDPDALFQVGVWHFDYLTPDFIERYLQFTGSQAIRPDVTGLSPFEANDRLLEVQQEVERFWAARETDDITIIIEGLPLTVDWSGYRVGQAPYHFKVCVPSHLSVGPWTVFANFSTPLSARRNVYLYGGGGCKAHAAESGWADVHVFETAVVYVDNDTHAQSIYDLYQTRRLLGRYECHVSHTQSNGVICDVNLLEVYLGTTSIDNRIYGINEDGYFWD